jgi:hypothetical protein
MKKSTSAKKLKKQAVPTNLELVQIATVEERKMSTFAFYLRPLPSK